MHKTQPKTTQTTNQKMYCLSIMLKFQSRDISAYVPADLAKIGSLNNKNSISTVTNKTH